jgi:hypothetical protein
MRTDESGRRDNNNSADACRVPVSWGIRGKERWTDQYHPKFRMQCLLW